MNKKRKSLCSAICVLILVFSLCFNVSAAFLESYDVPVLLSEKCQRVPVFLNGRLIGKTYERHGVHYIPVTEFLEDLTATEWQLNCDLPYCALSLSSDAFEFYCYPEHKYIYANGRYIPLGGIPRKIEGKICFPVTSIAKLFGAQLKISENASSIRVTYKSGTPVPTANEMYNQEDLYWLSRVIFSEAGTQPLEGMIGVGNVVLNRVASPRFPDNVHDVIFQENQFSVVDYGMIYREPDQRSIIAAMLCLEGYDSVGDSLYFINPDLCNGSWFRNNLTFRERIGDHDFFV